MTPSQILRKAKALIDTPEKWTKGTTARNSSGVAVSASDNFAICFDSFGALVKLDLNKYQSIEAVNYLHDAFNIGGGVVKFNDTHTHAEVMAKWDEAIALAEADEKEVCDTCNGTGVQCFGTSGLAEDGNAPILEPCGICGYGNEQGGV